MAETTPNVDSVLAKVAKAQSSVTRIRSAIASKNTTATVPNALADLPAEIEKLPSYTDSPLVIEPAEGDKSDNRGDAWGILFNFVNSGYDTSNGYITGFSMDVSLRAGQGPSSATGTLWPKLVGIGYNENRHIIAVADSPITITTSDYNPTSGFTSKEVRFSGLALDPRLTYGVMLFSDNSLVDTSNVLWGLALLSPHVSGEPWVGMTGGGGWTTESYTPIVRIHDVTGIVVPKRND